MVGRPRPDLIDRCQPPLGATDHPLYGLSTVDICTNTDAAQLNDGFKVGTPTAVRATQLIPRRASQVDTVLVSPMFCRCELTCLIVSIVRWSRVPLALPRRKDASVRPSGTQGKLSRP